MKGLTNTKTLVRFVYYHSVTKYIVTVRYVLTVPNIRVTVISKTRLQRYVKGDQIVIVFY